MNRIKLAVRAFLAGIMIAIGGTVFVSLLETSKIVGSILFSVGLFTICTFGFALFTGMAGYLFDGKPLRNVIDLLIVWVFNLAGCVAAGFLLRLALGESATLVAAGKTLAETKVVIEPIKAFVTGVFCGILMYIAVDNFRNHSSMLSKYLGILLCVPAFILAGFEHSIADMFYLALGLGIKLFTGKALAFLALVSLGNVTGAVCFAFLRRFENQIKQKKQARRSSASLFCNLVLFENDLD